MAPFDRTRRRFAPRTHGLLGAPVRFVGVIGVVAALAVPSGGSVASRTLPRPAIRPVHCELLRTVLVDCPRSVPVTTTTTPSVSSCGGETPAATNRSAWTCTFDDEFSTNTLDPRKWAVQTTAGSGFTAGPVCFVNNPNNVSISGGTLNLTVRKEATPFVCRRGYSTQYTAGEVMTYNLFSQAYGRFEVRARFPASTVAGLQSALWLFPQNYAKFGPWPWSGEIDIAEEYSRYADRAIPYIHYVPATTDSHVTNDYCLLDVSAFHTYTVLWTSSSITILFDGKTCVQDTWTPAPPLVAPEPFNQPFMIALTQGLGIGGNAFDAATTPLPATTQIDYVRVWA